MAIILYRSVLRILAGAQALRDPRILIRVFVSAPILWYITSLENLQPSVSFPFIPEDSHYKRL